MSEADNLICLVCNKELDPESDGVVVVDALNWHKECLGFIPQPHNYDHISKETGHAIKKVNGSDVDASVLFGSPPDEFYHREGSFHD